MSKGHEGKSEERKSPAVQSRPGPYHSGKGKGKSKSKSKGSTPRMPTVLLEGGRRAFTNKGEPICSLPVNNGRCERASTHVPFPSVASTIHFCSAHRRSQVLDQAKNKGKGDGALMERLRRIHYCLACLIPFATMQMIREKLAKFAKAKYQMLAVTLAKISLVLRLLKALLKKLRKGRVLLMNLQDFFRKHLCLSRHAVDALFSVHVSANSVSIFFQLTSVATNTGLMHI